MQFSVLMSLYAKEQPEFLRRSLDSVFNQSLVPDEVVMVEDGPLTEDLYKVLSEYGARYPQLKRVPLSKNGGLGRALNEGLKHCSNDLVARMDTDDICLPNRFEKQLAVFKQFPQVDVVSAWIEEFDSETQEIISQRQVPELSYELYEYGKKRCPINHPVVMFRRNVVLFAGNYRPFPLFEDYYLWVRLLLNGAKFYNVQEVLLKFRTSPDMYKRRGGLKHALDEIRFQWQIKRLKYTTWKLFFTNVGIRFTTRVMPNSFRTWVYQKLLRRKIK